MQNSVAAVAVLILIASNGPLALAAPLILNEYNAVSDSNFLNGGDESMDDDGNIPPPADPFFGRVAGNGDDWFELVVVGDGLDLRGWQLEISDDGVVQPRLVLSSDPVWIGLSAGTIITVAEQVADDVSYDPGAGDWWINVMAADPANGGTGQYITASDFPVSKDDWQLKIYDADGNLVFGPSGEGIVGDDGVAFSFGVSSREVFELGTDPSAIIGRDSPFYFDGIYSSFGLENTIGESPIQDFNALRLGLPQPDSDGDGIADDGDRSGVPGDHPCASGVTTDCDDNCAFAVNPGQLDTGGLGSAGPDGVGNACQCGDVDDNGRVTGVDAGAIRLDLIGAGKGLAAPDRCNVFGEPACGFDDALAIDRALQGLPPGVGQVCEPASNPATNSDLLYDATQVLQVDIAIDPADWEQLRLQTRSLVDLISDPDCGEGPWSSPFTWFSADITVDGELFENVGIRKKGFFGSLSETKPALKLEFDRFVPGQRINGLVRMTLNNSTQDPSLAKQCIAFGFFKDAGIPTPRCNHASLTVNGDPLGVYVNVEEVNEQFVARNFDDGSGALFEGEVSDFWMGPWIGTFDPDTEVAEDDNSAILALADVMLNASNADLVSEVRAHIDLNQYLAYWAAEAIGAHTDGYHQNMNNYYVYADPSVGVMKFMPWDMDQDLGPDDADIFVIRSALARRLYNVTPARNAFLARVQTVLDEVWDPQAYVAEVDRVGLMLEPVLNAAGLQEELELMLEQQDILRTWIEARRAIVEEQLADAPSAVLDIQVPHLCEMGGMP